MPFAPADATGFDYFGGRNMQMACRGARRDINGRLRRGSLGLPGGGSLARQAKRATNHSGWENGSP